MSVLDKTDLKIRMGSEKNFGFVFSGVFFIISIYFWLNERNIYLLFLTTSFIFIVIAIFYPKILKLPNKIWFKFGLFLGSIISPITMGIIFFLTVTPTGVIMRLLGKDILKKKKQKSKSYWIKKDINSSSMENQF